MDCRRLGARSVKVRRIGSEQKIVRLDRGTQKQRTLIPHPHYHFRQIARAIVEEALLAQAVGLHIAVPVEDSEHRSVFQYPGTVVRWRRRCGYVVLLGDVTFIQLRTPLEAASGAFFRFTSRS